MFATNTLSDSQVMTMTVIATAAVVYPLILLAIGMLGYFQSRGESKA